MAHPKMAEVQRLACKFLDEAKALVPSGDLPVMVLFAETSNVGAGFYVEAVFSTCTHGDAVESDIIKLLTDGQTDFAGKLGDEDDIKRAIDSVDLTTVNASLPRGKN